MATPATILSALADRTQAFLKVFRYDSPQQVNVLPLKGSVADGPGINGIIHGEVTLVAGVSTIVLPSINAGARVFLCRRTVAGTAGNLGYTKTDGVGFSITNSSNADTSIVGWMVVF